jgi:DNA invertase Pin-like site-specific DNA recombinase
MQVVGTAMAGSFVSYLRVSTDKQGRSGLELRLNAKQCPIPRGLRVEAGAEFVEIESGKNADRPQLAKALAEL